MESNNTSIPLLSAEQLSCDKFNFFTCVVVIGIVCLLGVVGNTTSVLVLWKHKTDSATIFLLQALSIADSVLLITTLTVYTFPQLYPIEQDIVLLIWPFSMMSHTATIWMTVLVTINRYCSICRAFSRGPNNPMRTAQLQVLLVVLLSIIYNIPRFFEHYPISDFEGFE